MKNLFKKEVADRNSISLILKHFHFRFRKKRSKFIFSKQSKYGKCIRQSGHRLSDKDLVRFFFLKET